MNDDSKQIMMQIIDLMGRLTALENILIKKKTITSDEYFKEIEEMSGKLFEKLNASVEK